MKILAVGDVVGERAAHDLFGILSVIKKKYSPDLVVVNGENAAGGRGLTTPLANEIFAAGADVITTGNHIWDREREVADILGSGANIVRPANYPDDDPGVGHVIVDVCGRRVLVLNISGNVYMSKESTDQGGGPRTHMLSGLYETAERVLTRARGSYDAAVVDIHAEATGEKLCFARWLDGNESFKAAAVWGTHTHIPTADAGILPHGTGYVTDLGMTGPRNGVLGIRADSILAFSKDKKHVKFEVADGKTVLDAVLFTLDEGLKCIEAKRVRGSVPDIDQ